MGSDEWDERKVGESRFYGIFRIQGLEGLEVFSRILLRLHGGGGGK